MSSAFRFNTHPFTSRLKNVESAGPDKWRASCPCSQNHKHNDQNKSLSIMYDRQNGKLLVNCFTGCTVTEICEAVGCSVADLFAGKNPYTFLDWFTKKNGLTLVESYSYCYGQYNDGLCKIRFRKPDGTKDFRWMREDSSKASGYAMTHTGSAHRLYVAGSIKTDTVFVVEGEKDANTVHSLINKTAVSAENGASRSDGGKWLEEYNQQLTGKTVYILWDNDDIGKQFAMLEAQQITRTAAAVYLLDLPAAWADCPEKADISDYVKAVGPEKAAQTLDVLISTAEKHTAPALEPAQGENVISWDDIITKDYPVAGADPEQPIPGKTLITTPGVEEPAALKNTIPDLITYDADYINNTDIPEPEPIIDQILFPGLGMLGAPAKMGKTYMVLQLGCCVVTGKPFMGFSVLRPGPVLYMDLQGALSRTKKRLRDIGFPKMPRGLSLTYKARTTDLGLVTQLERWITTRSQPPVLIIIDMLQQVKGSQRRTEDSYSADNRILEPLHDLALKYNLSVLCVMHTRKGNKILPGDDPFNEIIGSIAQFGSADCAWMIIGRRTDDRKRFSVICRDNDSGQMDFEATFRDYKCKITGTVEDCEEEREISRYNQNPVVFTIRKLLEESPTGWIGKMSDLIQEVANKTRQYPANSPEQMRRLLNTVEYRLSCEGIVIRCLDPNGGKHGRRCKIYRPDPEQQRIEY